MMTSKKLMVLKPAPGVISALDRVRVKAASDDWLARARAESEMVKIELLMVR